MSASRRTFVKLSAALAGAVGIDLSAREAEVLAAWRAKKGSSG